MIEGCNFSFVCGACVLTHAERLAVVPLFIGITVSRVIAPQDIPHITAVVGNSSKHCVRVHCHITVKDASQQSTVGNCMHA